MAFQPPFSSSPIDEVPPRAEDMHPSDHHRSSDSDTPVAPIPLRPSTSSRPASRMVTATPSKTPIVNNRPSVEIDPQAPAGGGSASRSQKPARCRGDGDYEHPGYWYDGPPTARDYDRYWRGEYFPYPDRYTSNPRRSYRPPPPSWHRYQNSKRMAYAGDSDDDMPPYDERRVSRDMVDARRRAPGDEEAALPNPASRPLLENMQPGHRGSWMASNMMMSGRPDLAWENMTRREKAQVMRLPLTEWMNSSVKNHFVASLGEVVGTTMFLFFAFAGTQVANIGSNSDGENTTTGEATGFNVATLLYISLSFGFSLMVNVWIFFRISGGLFNPAVTLGMILVRAISIARGSFNVRTTLGGGASLVQGVFIEAILTAELVFTIFMLAKEKHKATFIAPVGIGLALFISELVGVQFTGGSLNPARSFGPCVVTGQFDPEHWIYWVGPFVGSILAVLFYRFIKTLEYEMANPGADGDDANDPTKNPEKMAEIQEPRAPSFRS
ncbi:aquaporin-like protein [Emericellopsis atlantica]|uniref:Aquaporin-like protein n=1 Tax=Emericellopsis atlantica TaxID=2614577 RepID=A0A9P7ZI15_9HYPO|nr:aquaporin-like protein [Emericellopsis atlantica]KAG9252415.1 aquaporin-like protein [Emericellopsis atlantica]